MSSGEESNNSTDPAGDASGTAAPAAGRVVFKLPPSSLIFTVVLGFCVIPLAGVGGFWTLMYLVPLAALAWTLLTRTIVDPRGITVHSWQGSHTLPWKDLVNLELTEARWTVALDVRGRRTKLPMVLPRDLPALAAASGGAIRFEMPAPESGGEVGA